MWFHCLVASSLFWTAVFCCRDAEFSCGNGRCVYPSRVCDGNKDCDDNSDESFCDASRDTCPSFTKKCGDSSFCFAWEDRCDGKLDCPNGFDERNCLYQSCPSGQTRCHHGACAPSGVQCCRMANGQCAVSTTSFRTTNKTLVFTSGREIYSMSPMDHSKHFVEESEGSYIAALTYSAQKNTIFWNEGSNIWEVKIGGRKNERKRLIGTIDPECSVKHMAYDWITGNFYLVCQPSRVMVCGSSNKTTHNRMLCARLYTFEYSRVISLALDPSMGFMYLVGSVGTRLRFIEARSDGESSELIYRGRNTGSELLSKAASGFDIRGRKIWLLQPTDEFALSFDLINREATTIPSDLFGSSASARVVFSDFGIVEQSPGIYAVFFRGSAVQIEHIDLSADNRLFTLLDTNAQPAGVNYCENLTCVHLCLLRPGGAVCKCDSDYDLQEDGFSCSLRLRRNSTTPKPQIVFEAGTIVPKSESRSSNLIHLTYLTVIALASITCGFLVWHSRVRRGTCRNQDRSTASACLFSGSGDETSATLVKGGTPII